MTFHLKTMPFGTTLARQIAKQNLSRFNNAYWVGERSYRHTKAAFPSLRFPTPAPGVHGVYHNSASWESAVDEFHEWTRQHIIVSAASLLEVYLKSVAVTAFSAKPGLIDKNFDGIDGFKFIKYDKTAPKYLAELIKTRSDSVVVGPWRDRLHRLSLIVGALPTSLLDLEHDLQLVQSKRNKIAHQFGSDESQRRAPWQALKAVQIGPKDVNDGITSVSQAIRILDETVFGPLIGGHEVLHEYHLWCQRQKNLRHLQVSGKIGSSFRDHLGGVFGAAIGAEYAANMINYYNKL